MKIKQIEKKAKEIVSRFVPNEDNDEFLPPFYAQKAAMEMAEWLLSHQWVSVEDELPKEGAMAIVTFIDYKGKRRYATGENTGAGMQVYGVISPSPFPNVTHWMPIPPLAKKGGKE